MELDVLNLMQICRTCKCVAPQMRSLFEVYENAHQSPRIDEMLMACASVQVLCGDGMPAQICQICVEQLRNAFVFKQQVERIDVNLREYVTNIKIDKIKKEPQNADFMEPLNTLNNFLNEQAKENNQEPSNSPTIPKIETDYIQFLDNDQMLLTCYECSKIFGTVEGLRCHKRVHTGNFYKCRKCDKQYTKLTLLQRHEESHSSVAGVNGNNNHSSKVEKVTECPSIEIDGSKEVKVEDTLKMEDNILDDGRNSLNIECDETESMVKDKIEGVVDMGLNDELINEATMTSGNDHEHDSKMEKVVQCLENEIVDSEEVKVEDTLKMEDSLEDENNIVNIDHDAGETFEDTTDPEFLPKSLSPKIKRSRGRPRKYPPNAPKIKVPGRRRGRPKIKKEEEQGEFPCRVCQEAFSTTSALDKHIETNHQGLKVYKCNVCNKQFRGTSHLKRHVASHSSVRAYCCRMCTKRFKTRCTLKQHEKLHERSSEFKCDICQKTFNRAGLLTNHKASEHDIGEKIVFKKKYECPLCHKGFTTEYYRDIHTEKHNRQKEYHCSVCEKTFPSKSHLTKHMQFNHECGKKFLCSECGMRFFRKDYFITHMRRHRGEKPFNCQYCGKGFPRLVDLTVHERYHTGEKTHLCTICGKGFGRGYSLTVHMRTHTGEKPYRCTYCDAAFAQGNDLKTHIRRHTGERFHCELCSKSFLMGYMLTQHKRTVHGLNVTGNIRRLQDVHKQENLDELPPTTIPQPKPVVPDMCKAMHVDIIHENTLHEQLTVAQFHLTRE